MSLTPTRMKRVDVIMLEKDVRKATVALGRLGVLHLVEVKPEEADMPMTRRGSADDLETCKSLLARVNVLAEKLGLAELPQADSYDAVAAIEQRVGALEERVDAVLSEQGRLDNESEEIRDTIARLRALDPLRVRLARMAESPFLHFAVGTLGASVVKRVSAEVRDSVVILERPGGGLRRGIIAITGRKGRFALNTLLEQHGFVPKDTSDAPEGEAAEALAELEQRSRAIEKERSGLKRELADIGRGAARDIAAFEHRLRLEEALIEAELNFGQTASTCLIRGWLPEDSVTPVSHRLLEATRGRMIMDVREPDEAGEAMGSVPVLMRNHPLIKPFELLVSGFGIPRYREIEPTIVVAVTFLAMYGLMFGDVGHGLLLALLGLIVRRISRESQVRDVATIMCFAAIAATLGGFLYGSVFGTALLPPLWMRPMRNVIHLLGLTILGGALLISTGVILNIVNRFRAGDCLGAIFSPFGIVGIVFYWGAIFLVLRSFYGGSSAPSMLQLVLLVFVPLVILFFRRPILNLLARKEQRDGTGLFSMLMEGAVEVMDTVSTYLANTVSFARVGAFALAHEGLCIAVLSLATAVGGMPGGVFWQSLALVLGTALVILLEGLIVFVQCLRLEYYEFFGKFFEGTGRKYQPFKLS